MMRRTLPLHRFHLLFIAAFLLCFAQSGRALVFDPIQACTESYRVDSTLEKVFVDIAMKPENAPYHSTVQFSYQGTTCFPELIRNQPYFIEYELRTQFSSPQDSYSSAFTMSSGDSLTSNSGRIWMQPSGWLDSTLFIEAKPDSTLPPRRRDLVRHLRKGDVEIHEEWISQGDAAYELYARDSVWRQGSAILIHSLEDGIAFETQCTTTDSSLQCEPDETGKTELFYGARHWFFSKGHPDSLQTYNEKDELVSTTYFYTSPRSSNTLIWQRPRRQSQTRNAFKNYRVDGRILNGRFWNDSPAKIR